MKVKDIFPTLAGKGTDDRIRTYLTPKKVVWTSGAETVENAETLLMDTPSQIGLGGAGRCVLRNAGEDTARAALVVDYGVEFHGSLRIYVAWQSKEAGGAPNVRIRFGESVAECMAEFGEKNTTNDHANRDMVIQANAMSANETNCSGYRFVRIDLLDDNSALALDALEGVFIHRDLDYLGTFKCNDEEVNKIWDTAAYTVHLNMQEYLWDGIKRDRLVWIGDMHTEVMTIQAVFGGHNVVTKSLDYVRDNTPLPGWMNNISAYSMWWILIHYDWFMYTADSAYLAEQREYLKGLMQQLADHVDEDGREKLPEWRFLDWPNSTNPQGVNAGLQGLMTLSLQRGGFLLEQLGENELASKCMALYELAKKHCPDANGSKQGAAVEAWAGLGDAKELNDKVIAPGGANGFSTFMGYYILKAKALAGDFDGALADMKDYWGGMLKMGATTFWEDFDLKWMENAARVDELVPEGKVDIHGDYGNYCYQQFRHSLCHGWSSGPVPWLSEFVLGVSIVEPGCKVLKVEPHLCGLTEVSGSYPTSYGVVKISHKLQADGSVETVVDAPEQVKIVKG